MLCLLPPCLGSFLVSSLVLRLTGGRSFNHHVILNLVRRLSLVVLALAPVVTLSFAVVGGFLAKRAAVESAVCQDHA